MLYDRDGSGAITIEEMKSMFVMMCHETAHNQLEPTQLKLYIKGLEQKAEEMFDELDADSDGFLTQDEFIDGCMQNEDLMKHLETT